MGKKYKEKGNKIVWILAIIGCVAAVAAIAYAVYRFFTPDYLEDLQLRKKKRLLKRKQRRNLLNKDHRLRYSYCFSMNDQTK